ncbi:hypothetical protein Bca4012_067437 [Brassica carinata]|uniref:Uncharacterized protein n=1 Tax=Brassica carinata TaxID=52824 RepID=A0A8X7VS16_BRACI|nr:hypothetical protein Bca52824_019698 [Brassica carinata]
MSSSAVFASESASPHATFDDHHLGWSTQVSMYHSLKPTNTSVQGSTLNSVTATTLDVVNFFIDP